MVYGWYFLPIVSSNGRFQCILLPRIHGAMSRAVFHVTDQLGHKLSDEKFIANLQEVHLFFFLEILSRSLKNKSCHNNGKLEVIQCLGMFS